jgi:SAM-dependent methyltransferase
MQDIVYHTNYELEDSYWWFTARQVIVDKLIKVFTNLKPGQTILDVGCGTGGFTKHMAQTYNMIGLDTSELALEFCRKRGLENLFCGQLSEFPKDKYKVDAITMLDVVEHIPDDRAVVKDVFNLLPSGGYYIMTVPAYQWLWSKHDEVHMHYRRYTKKRINQIIIDAGFNIEFSSYMNSFLFLPAVLKRFSDRFKKKDDSDSKPVDEVSPMLNTIFDNLYKFEANILKLIRIPFGLSVVTIAKKP